MQRPLAPPSWWSKNSSFSVAAVDLCGKIGYNLGYGYQLNEMDVAVEDRALAADTAMPSH
jgi:hypothetical protein